MKNLNIIVLYLITIVFPVNELFAQISPGELTKAHSKLEGISNCTKCHELGKEMNNSGCLDCHTEIKRLINSNRGYHSGSDVRGKNCWSCHSEHHGREYKIIKFESSKFDHNKTGYELTGAHQKIECRNCHKPEFISDNNLKQRAGTYLGLSNTCNSCHTDYHQNTLGDDCSSCHNTESFRPAPGFDHNTSGFKLTGAHNRVSCNECHSKEERNGKEFQIFKGISFTNCSSCHKDIHEGRFGHNCQSCHITSSFKEINRTAFDHNKTRFPLIGKHKEFNCNDCHKESISFKPKFEQCIDCHNDYHKGQFIENEIIKDCKSCHNEYGFSPSLFTIENHNTTKFNLSGGHLAVPCKSCHLKNDDWKFTNISTKCVDCHNNVHGSELIEKYLPENDCSFCHSTEKWSEVKFEHIETGFQLLGRHIEISCSDCHYRDFGGRKIFRFASLNSNCEVCHKDIHYGQFRNEENETINCARCHTYNNWKPDLFNHDKSGFPLKGAHKNIPCYECHKIVEQSDKRFIQFKIEDFRCVSCHS